MYGLCKNTVFGYKDIAVVLDIPSSFRSVCFSLSLVLQHISITMNAPIYQMNEEDSTLLRSWSTAAERYREITERVKIMMLTYAPTPQRFDDMESEIRKIILEGLGDQAVTLMAESNRTKSAREKTPAEIELAKERSKLVRRIFNLYKLLFNYFIFK